MHVLYLLSDLEQWSTSIRTWRKMSQMTNDKVFCPEEGLCCENRFKWQMIYFQNLKCFWFQKVLGSVGQLTKIRLTRNAVQRQIVLGTCKNSKLTTNSDMALKKKGHTKIILIFRFVSGANQFHLKRIFPKKRLLSTGKTRNLEVVLFTR